MIHYTITEHVGGTSKMKTKLKRLFNVTIMTMAVAIAPEVKECIELNNMQREEL